VARNGAHLHRAQSAIALERRDPPGHDNVAVNGRLFDQRYFDRIALIELRALKYWRPVDTGDRIA
jgi:hypothetical protein